MAFEFPASPCVRPKDRLIPRKAGAVQVSGPRDIKHVFRQDGTEACTNRTSQLYRQIGDLLQKDIHEPQEPVSSASATRDILNAEVLALSDEDIAEPIDHEQSISYEEPGGGAANIQDARETTGLSSSHYRSVPRVPRRATKHRSGNLP